ncbi:MAG TPA: protein kinase [Thermoanaerobaculia bacterium]|nr:protein kinase [Thermoanaerobaculia bacterium]
MVLSSGTRLGPYEILAPLGAGGMGEVYRARDQRLGREVAVKVLPGSLASDPDALARFEREARAVAALSHPNVLAIHDFGRQDGVAYAVMELLHGETLRDRLGSGALPRKAAVDFALQIAKGLAAAHEKGIVHRDLKPENIFVTREGHLKILDFGLAKRTERSGADDADTDAPTLEPTRSGAILGTVGYMSPEQVRGEALDQRSDIFSFGTVLYEMLTGRRAFRHDSATETMAAILMKEPTDVAESGTKVSSGLAAIVRHCLEKNADQRFQSARDLVFNLQQLAGGEGAPAPPSSMAPSVAVLPFLSFSADPENEFFADGVTEDVIANLSKIRSLKVISRTSVMVFKKREASLREIGAKLGAATILEGSIRRAGNRVRIVAQLIDAQTDEHLWAETFDRELTDIFQIQTEVALHIADALKAELSIDERSRIEKPPTQSARAYQLYLQARSWFYRSTEEGYRRAIDYFQQAIEEDPEFALAHAGLASLYSEFATGQGEGAVAPDVAFGKARAAVEKALALDPGLADAHSVAATLKFMCDYDWKGAEKEFELALTLAPGNADIYDRYGWLCSALGRRDDAIRLVARAQELDPLAHRSDLASELLRAGRYGEAIEAAQRVVEFEPEFSRGHSILGWARILSGHPAEGIPELERAVALSPGSTLFLCQLGQAYAMAGRTDDARRILERISGMEKDRYVSPYHVAYVYTGLGENEKAMDLLEKAYRERAGAIYGIKGSFLFTSLRLHPRFHALLAKMNLA